MAALTIIPWHVEVSRFCQFVVAFNQNLLGADELTRPGPDCLLCGVRRLSKSLTWLTKLLQRAKPQNSTSTVNRTLAVLKFRRTPVLAASLWKGNIRSQLL